MKALGLNLLFCASILIQLRFEQALAAAGLDTTQPLSTNGDHHQAVEDRSNSQQLTTSPIMQVQQQQQKQQQQQQQQLAQANNFPRLSCYVCSTMDYENSADNVCRSMKHHQKRQSGLHHHQSLPVAHHSLPVMTANYEPNQQQSQVTVPPNPSEISGNGSPNLIPSMKEQQQQQQASSSPADIESSSLNSLALNDYSSSQTGTGEQMFQSNHDETTTQLVNTSTAAATTNTTTNTAMIAQQNYFPQQQYRAPHPANFIRVRPCLDDEHFCSAVSIFHLEHVNDRLVSRFWATERNCSRSCNSGCMVIGERVRFKVCSKCCNSPNCNIGNSASSVYNSSLNPPNQFASIVLLMPLILVALLLNFDRKSSTTNSLSSL